VAAKSATSVASGVTLPATARRVEEATEAVAMAVAVEEDMEEEAVAVTAVPVKLLATLAEVSAT